MSRFAIGIDLGATSIKCALVSDEGDILSEARRPTEGANGKDFVISGILGVIDELLDAHHSNESITGVGVGVPGVVGYDGVINTLTNIPDWRNVNLAASLQHALKPSNRFSTRVFVENDANIAALGEAQFGAGKAFNDFVMITLGTGVGGGIIVNKKIFRGSTGGAGELGHITIDFKSDIVHAGIRGSLEGLIGHRQITAYTKMRLEQTPSKILFDLCNGDYSKLEPKVLTQAAKQGDELSIAVWRYVGEILGVGIGSIISVMDIRKFVIGGGVGGAGKFVLEPTLEQAKRFSLPAMHEGLEVLSAQLGTRAGVIGAAALCF